MKACLKPGDTFVDIGANEGTISLLASSLVGRTGKVLSLEPNPRPREVFRSNIEHNAISNIHLFPTGLGERDDVLVLTVPKINSVEGSFGRPEDRNTIPIMFIPSNAGLQRQRSNVVGKASLIAALL